MYISMLKKYFFQTLIIKYYYFIISSEVFIMITYKRHTHYHETDQMGVIHHSKYLCYLEEARIFMLDYMGISYKKME